MKSTKRRKTAALSSKGQRKAISRLPLVQGIMSRKTTLRHVSWTSAEGAYLADARWCE